MALGLLEAVLVSFVPAAAVVVVLAALALVLSSVLYRRLAVHRPGRSGWPWRPPGWPR